MQGEDTYPPSYGGGKAVSQPHAKNAKRMSFPPRGGAASEHIFIGIG